MSLPESQRAVAAFLARLAGREPVETHISAVFIGAERVLKIKKAVRLPYLDFTTLAARRHFTEREFEVNKPEAPALYQDVLAVDARPDHELVLLPAELARTPVEYVLQMAPVPARDFLDLLADSGGLTPDCLDDVADRVAASHARRPPVRGWDSFAALSALALAEAVAARASALPESAVSAWENFVTAALGQVRYWLQARAAGGFVKRCHGDLHLGNVCLFDGKPVLFDALEFDEAMATIDTGFDLAFLLMDLDVRAGRAAANRVMNRVLARSFDAGMTRGLPLFMSLRAMVRAYVMVDGGKRAAAQRYLDRMLGYIAPETPRIVAIGGLQGSGKSTLARAIAPDLGRAPGAVVLRSDELRKRVFNVAPDQRLPGEAYGETPNAIVRQLLVETSRVVASGGHAVVADATFSDPALREAIVHAARDAGCRFTGIWLTAPRDLLEQRLRQRRHDASDATAEVLAESIRKTVEPADWIRLDSTDMAGVEAACRSRLRLALPGAPAPAA
jgi:hypothetical protein